MKPSLKKPGDFIVAEGHGHPLVTLTIMFIIYFGANIKLDIHIYKD
jgi:hypothetical protein